MIIHITGRLGESRTSPERAEVAAGETVQWLIEVVGGTRAIRWEVYFQGRSPFRQRAYNIRTEVRVSFPQGPRPEEAVHIGRIDAGEANEPGEYKYGVRAVDDATRAALSDDDPYIIVRRRPQ